MWAVSCFGKVGKCMQCIDVFCCLQCGSTVSMHDATSNQPLVQRQPNSPIFPPMPHYHQTVKTKKQTNQKKKNKQMSMKRLRSTSYSSSYHCPVSKRLDCSGWLSDWPRALAGRAGHCEGRLGNELEIGDPTIQTDFSGQKRRNKQPGWERLAGNREENSCEVMETQKDLTKGFLFHQQLKSKQCKQVHSVPYVQHSTTANTAATTTTTSTTTTVILLPLLSNSTTSDLKTSQLLVKCL